MDQSLRLLEVTKAVMRETHHLDDEAATYHEFRHSVEVRKKLYELISRIPLCELVKLAEEVPQRYKVPIHMEMFRYASIFERGFKCHHEWRKFKDSSTEACVWCFNERDGYGE